MLNVRDLHKSFGAIRALSGVSFDAGKGEIFGVVGPDGAGKSTLLRILASTLQPDKGSVSVEGTEIRSALFTVREKIAYMPQRFGLYEDLTVEENIHFFGRLFGATRREIADRSVRLYEFSRLGPFKNRLAGKLSGGMKQKLGLACALIHTPSLIILDEPTNGVDPVSRREFWMILYDLLASGVTIVVSTAYLDEAERCGRVALMDRGQFMVVDTPRRIKESVGEKFIVVESRAAHEAESVMRTIVPSARLTRTGNVVRAFVPQDGINYPKIARAALVKKGIPVEAARYAVPSLEDCFNELIAARGKHRRRGEDLPAGGAR